jgi:hypothetical protein
VTTQMTTDSTSIWSVERVHERFAPAYEKLKGLTARGLTKLGDLAPYAAIELILPGGSLIALFLWLYNQNKRNTTKPLSATPVVQGYSEA